MSESTSLCKRSVRKLREGEALSRAKRWANAFEVIRFAACAARLNGGAMAGCFCKGWHEARTEDRRGFERSVFSRAQTSEKQRTLADDRGHDAIAYHVFCFWRVGEDRTRRSVFEL